MPEDSKKNQDKKRNDPKEQRKARNPRNQGSKVDKKTEKVEESKFVPKVPQKPPVYEDPGPEFYKNLKRETEEILKITEEENSRYKKKEIQSNWSKYEMPIETYEDIEEHDIGADYEKLIQAPLSIGGHFQFKHEKSWDVNTGPSLYDKYFEINMDNLSLAVSTIPFYDRNGVDESLFSETDMLSMNSRATKYKQKYYDDKTYSTPETEAQDRILNSLKESLSKKHVDNEKIEKVKVENYSVEKIAETLNVEEDDIDLDFTFANTGTSSTVHTQIEDKGKIKERKKSLESNVSSAKSMEDGLVLEHTPKVNQEIIVEKVIEPIIITETESTKTINEPTKEITPPKSTGSKVKDISMGAKKNPVIESPEDLEKWLDDFLDG